MLSERYQFSLIALCGVAVTILGFFTYRELFPEYKIYQNAYVELENFRSEKTGVPPPVFKSGVKQVVMLAEDRGPESLDRCVSCHVATKLSHFSPTKVAKNINGDPLLDEEGKPILVENEEYVWGQIDEKIAFLRDEKVNSQLEKEGKSSEVASRLQEADELEAMKHVEVGEHHYDMTKVLAMHPLIGRETIPFEFHPLEEYGCSSCHGGNGRGLVTDRAHGPVYDGQYEEAHMGPEPEFLEQDGENDPEFTKVFNHKPGHRLLFQTTPLLVGSLMQAKCVQCHQSTEQGLQSLVGAVDSASRKKREQVKRVEQALQGDREAIFSLLTLQQELASMERSQVVARKAALGADLSLPAQQRERYLSQKSYLEQLPSSLSQDALLQLLADQLKGILGSEELFVALQEKVKEEGDVEKGLNGFWKQGESGAVTTGLFAKFQGVKETQEAIQRVENAVMPLASVASNKDLTGKLQQDTDRLTHSFQRGEALFRSSACYACHKIAGYSRGGVGPELTEIGLYYPWYIKEAIVWPQGNLPSSTMPNYKLDTEEVEDLMTFLLAQRNGNQFVSEFNRSIQIKEWEAGLQMEWEKPLPSHEIRDVKKGMEIFATEGCSACHRLKGYSSEVGLLAEKDGDFSQGFAARQWFSKLVPDGVAGSILVKILDEHGEEIDEKIGRSQSGEQDLDLYEKKYPGLIPTMYSNFKYAFRAKNKHFADLEKQARSDEERLAAREGLAQWQDRVHRVLMAYVQEYGLGRQIGPNLHWSGLYRDTEWLVGHFRNPGAHSAKSIMPVLPFDDSKFYALTHMLQVVGQENRDRIREVWNYRGFDPALAYEWHCSACHGQYLGGNGPIAEWIYPIPKNLRNATFLRNLTKDRAIQSIVHGVVGGPMPPWGEAPLVGGKSVGTPVMTPSEIEQLVDWLYQGLPGSRVIRGEGDVDKWQYEAEDVIRDLFDEGAEEQLRPSPPQEEREVSAAERSMRQEILASQASIEGVLVSLEPLVQQKSPWKVSELFDVEEDPLSAKGEKRYYIKREYYTPENLEAGKRLFIANCAHCHGKLGGGNGDRATTMEDAKPRMLSNLPWLRTRDDLRIIRSIKYGVPGTSMTPWGDKTSTLQRIQMVTYIRSLTDERRQREDLISTLFQAFESDVLVLEEARSDRAERLAAIDAQYQAASQKRETLLARAQQKEASTDEVARAYGEELRLMQQIQELKEEDGQLVNLLELLGEEQETFSRLGKTLISKKLAASVFTNYLKLVERSGGRYSLQRGALQASFPGNEELDVLSGELLAYLDAKVATLSEKAAKLSGELASAQRLEKESEVGGRLNSFEEIRGKLKVLMSETKRVRDAQKQIYEKLLEGSFQSSLGAPLQQSSEIK